MTNDTSHPASTPPDDLFRQACRAVFDAMARQRIDLLKADYDGYGDSGQIDAARAYRITPDETDEADAGTIDERIPVEPFDPKLIELADTALSLFDPIHGYENNEGAFGTVTFDRRHQRVTIDHNWRVTETELEVFEQEL